MKRSLLLLILTSLICSTSTLAIAAATTTKESAKIKSTKKNIIKVSESSPITTQRLPGFTAKTLLECLAKEESLIHQRKNIGPIYYLNQTLVNEFLVNDLKLTTAFVQEICDFKAFTPSLKLLQYLLFRKEALFIISKDPNEKLAQMAMIDDLVGRAPQFFVTYLGHLQALTPFPRCLDRNIPAMISYFQDYKYQESDNPNALFNPAKLNKIFERLKNFDQIYSDCVRREKARKEKEKNLAKGEGETNPEKEVAPANFRPAE